MSTYLIHSNTGYYYLEHHGIAGQKWGVRNAEWYPIDAYKAHLSRESRHKYKVDSTGRNIVRGLYNTTIGQKMVVRANKGYREDRAEIKSKYKKKLSSLDRKSDNYRQDKKKAKQDYKESKAAAATNAAREIYGRQSDEMNNKVQSMSVGKAAAQTFILSGYGSLKYNEFVSSGYGRALSAAGALISSIADRATLGTLDKLDYYTHEKTKSTRADKREEKNYKKSLKDASDKFVRDYVETNKEQIKAQEDVSNAVKEMLSKPYNKSVSSSVKNDIYKLDEQQWNNVIANTKKNDQALYKKYDDLTTKEYQTNKKLEELEKDRLSTVGYNQKHKELTKAYKIIRKK